MKNNKLVLIIMRKILRMNLSFKEWQLELAIICIAIITLLQYLTPLITVIIQNLEVLDGEYHQFPGEWWFQKKIHIQNQDHPLQKTITIMIESKGTNTRDMFSTPSRDLMKRCPSKGILISRDSSPALLLLTLMILTGGYQWQVRSTSDPWVWNVPFTSLCYYASISTLCNLAGSLKVVSSFDIVVFH